MAIRGLRQGEDRYKIGTMKRLPHRCVLEISYDCNLRCRTCNIWRRDFDVRRQISRRMRFDEICRLQSQLAAAGIRQISYVGGEPLMEKKIWQIVSHAGDNRMSTALVTNGSLWDDGAVACLFVSGLNTVIFSLDGPRSIHDSIRGKNGAFDRAFRSILAIQRQKKIRKLKRPKVVIYTTVSSLNHHALPDMLDIARKLDVNRLRFQLVSVVSREVADAIRKTFGEDVIGLHSYAVDGDLSLGASQLKAARLFLSRAQAWSKTVGIELQVEGCLEDPPLSSGCEFLHQSFVINPFGHMVPCPMLPGYIIGNLLEHSLERLWGNSLHKRMLRTLRRSGCTPMCSRCCVEKVYSCTIRSDPRQAI